MGQNFTQSAVNIKLPICNGHLPLPMGTALKEGGQFDARGGGGGWGWGSRGTKYLGDRRVSEH